MLPVDIVRQRLKLRRHHSKRPRHQAMLNSPGSRGRTPRIRLSVWGSIRCIRWCMSDVMSKLIRRQGSLLDVVGWRGISNRSPSSDSGVWPTVIVAESSCAETARRAFRQRALQSRASSRSRFLHPLGFSHRTAAPAQPRAVNSIFGPRRTARVVAFRDEVGRLQAYIRPLAESASLSGLDGFRTRRPQQPSGLRRPRR